MKIEIIPNNIPQSVKVSPSKSYLNRILILASISKNTIRINNIGSSSDVLDMIQCLRKLGVNIIKLNQNDIEITNSFPECELLTDSIIDIETGEGGTTNRFLIGLLSRGKNTYRIIPKAKMIDRPMNDLFETLKRLNVVIKDWTIKGPYRLENPEVAINSSISGQFASSLKMALHDFPIKVTPINLAGSEQYIELTDKLINSIKSNEVVFTAPMDFSSLSYPLALSVFSDELWIEDFKEIDIFQPDSILIEFLNNKSIILEKNSNGLKIKGTKKIFSFDLDCSPFPDLVPTLAFLASYGEGTSYLRNLKNLIHKESNRIAEISKILTLFNIDYNLDGHDLIIRGNPSHKANHVTYISPADHRMCMLAALFMIKNNGGIIEGWECVNKSYPDFFRNMGQGKFFN